MSHYKKATFLLSAAEVKQLPPDMGYEVAIVGRSNAGKSSVLNCITQNNKLARVSKTPGRTQQINIFVLDEDRRLMDLPGYGFAHVPLREKRKWEATINKYFEQRTCLKGLVLVMDIRHPFRDLDMNMLDYCLHHELPVHILLNKADKLSKGAAKAVLLDAVPILEEYGPQVTLQTFSAMKKTGVKELQTVLDKWYGYNS
ncbi:MAG TPA: ribosome biogenesis GTP-binding protein YihA/YsxC [Gammaproteobacteria bacterium]|jgi:GTP-binding protein|nr:ribosome biogenesis GTP-binding protein YihA/YsxC [Gammaproteobacteria bacterium]